MKRSVCFQLRNRSLLKFKSSYVIAETAAQQPPKQAAVPCAAVPEMSWLCASACPSTGEEHEGAQQAQAVFQGVPVDRFKLHSKALPESWCTVHVACLSFKVGRTGTFDRSTDFRTSFKQAYDSQTSAPVPAGNSGRGFCHFPTNAGPGLVPCWCQPWNELTTAEQRGHPQPFTWLLKKLSAQRPRSKTREMFCSL